jgi:hypothetical protein
MEFHWIPWNFPWNSINLSFLESMEWKIPWKIPWNPMGKSMEFSGIPRNSPWNCTKTFDGFSMKNFHGILCKTNGIPLNFPWNFPWKFLWKIPWNSMEFNGIPWKIPWIHGTIFARVGLKEGVSSWDETQQRLQDLCKASLVFCMQTHARTCFIVSSKGQ